MAGPKLLLETSEALSYLLQQPRWQSVEQLVAWAEAGVIELRMARAGWEELRPSDDPGWLERYRRLQAEVRYQGNVARLGFWRLGVDVLGHDDSGQVERDLPARMSLADRDHYLALLASGCEFLVTSDTAFTQKQTRDRVTTNYAFRIGSADEAVSYVRERLASSQ